jgi:phosphohistidine phosphatase
MRLMVLRHASSEKAEPGMRDFDSALNERGRKDAAKIGAYMAHHALLPDRVIVGAARARDLGARVRGVSCGSAGRL